MNTPDHGLRIPSEEDILEQKRHERCALPHLPLAYVSTGELIRDLARNPDLTSLMRDDGFAAQFQNLIHQNDLRWMGSQTLVVFLGEDSARMVTAHLRPHNEAFWEMHNVYKPPTEEVEVKIRSLLAACGYEVHDRAHHVPPAV